MACGHNKYGALGVGDFQPHNTFTPCAISKETEINSIDAGDGFTLFLTNKNELMSCGHRS